MGAEEVERFPAPLDVQGRVAVSTRNQVRCALMFPYKHVLNMEIKGKVSAERVQRTKRLPVMRSRIGIDRLIHQMESMYWPVAGLPYGAGLRLMERLCLQVKDVDVDQRLIVVWCNPFQVKGATDGFGLKGPDEF